MKIFAFFIQQLNKTCKNDKKILNKLYKKFEKQVREIRFVNTYNHLCINISSVRVPYRTGETQGEHCTDNL